MLVSVSTRKNTKLYIRCNSEEELIQRIEVESFCSGEKYLLTTRCCYLEKNHLVKLCTWRGDCFIVGKIIEASFIKYFSVIQSGAISRTILCLNSVLLFIFLNSVFIHHILLQSVNHYPLMALSCFRWNDKNKMTISFVCVFFLVNEDIKCSLSSEGFKHL